MTKLSPTEKIELLAAKEQSLVNTNSNGRNDAALYHLRKELDTLRRRSGSR